MPQLPSGLHFALDPAPLVRLTEEAPQGKRVADLMAIESSEQLFPYLDVLYFGEATADSLDPEYTPDSNRPPEGLEPYRSGYTLFSIRECFRNWPRSDQEAFEAFISGPQVQGFLSELMEAVTKTQKGLLSSPGTVAGLQAHWWKAGCHPFQETEGE